MLAYRKIFQELFDETRKIVVGQDKVIEQVMVAVVSDGNPTIMSVEREMSGNFFRIFFITETNNLAL